MIPISDELLQLECDKSDGLRSVELEAAGQTFLSERAEVGEDELVLNYKIGLIQRDLS